ncbi:LURP-one-related family protein [Nocardiopsis dassonvillei]|uniref:LURP-one-related/scramblase family protein n=1 Tax=Nocardiopsis dassonvillei TaxID=2014 RepID=UPI00200DA1B5|nr:LURP-one-related family protein [Nocardiopsis dassonvillei]MCK9873006.1 LURP-one-related family protein [Nocardiopsis dassonvillei]
MKFLVRERVFDIGDDYWVTDEAGEKVFLVDGKALRLRTTFELKDTGGTVLAVIRKKLFRLRDQMRVEREGGTTATVRKRLVNPLRDKLVVEVEGAPDWEVTGDFLDKEYVISDEHGTVAHVSRKWFRVLDTYAVDVNTHRADIAGDPALVISVAVAVDALTRDEDDEEGPGE